MKALGKLGIGTANTGTCETCGGRNYKVPVLAKLKGVKGSFEIGQLTICLSCEDGIEFEIEDGTA